jgi:hypothetical protein
MPCSPLGSSPLHFMCWGLPLWTAQGRNRTIKDWIDVKHSDTGAFDLHIMKHNLITLSRRYASALRKHLKSAAPIANARLNALNRRTVELAASNQSLKQSIVRRKTVEKALKKSGGHSQKLLGESHYLQNHLRYLPGEF